MTDFERYIIARWAYSVGQPIMTDAEYNIMHKAMVAKFPQSPYVHQSWSSDPCPATLLRKYGYPELIKAVVLSDKTESIPSLNTQIEVQAEYRYMAEPHVLSMKLDGWNIQASYYDGPLIHIQTRGRSTDAVDANKLRPLFPSTIPIKGKVLIIVELVVPDADFGWFKEHFGSISQRGACSTALARGGECLKHVRVIAHGIRSSELIPYQEKLSRLGDLGFQVPYFLKVYNYVDLNVKIDKMTEQKLLYGLPTDGLVCEGPTKVRALRIKGWEEPIYRSYVQGYEENFGPHSISTQLSIFPIKLANSTQRKLPATNLARIITMGLMPGAPVAFRFTSGSIADIDEQSTRMLQEEWKGRWPEYHLMVETNEALK